MDLPNLTPDDLSKIKQFGELAWKLMPARLKKAGNRLNDKSWNLVGWKRKATLYVERLYPRVATTRLLGHDKLIRIEEIFTDVYLYQQPLATQMRSTENRDENALRAKRFADERLRKPAKEILDQSRIYIVGKPGAGKTTLLRRLVLESISSNAGITPIFIQLKDIAEKAPTANDISLWKPIVSQFDVCKLPEPYAFVEDLFKSGKVALFLDGLDEVTAQNGVRARLIHYIQETAEEFPDIKIVLTCRTGAEDFIFENFSVAQIADFSPDQQVSFVKRWYANDIQALNSFLKQWAEPKSAGFRELASTPLLLALLCISFDETREFPLRRGDLYKEATEALLRKWSVSRGIIRDNPFQNFTASRKEQLLAYVAFHLFRERRFLFTPHDAGRYISEFLLTLPKQEAIGHFDPNDVIRHIEAAHGLLFHESSDLIAFSHLTIQEYFAARHLIDSSNGILIQRELTFENVSNPQWREVILLAAGLLNSADYLLHLIRKSVSDRLSTDPWVRRILEPLRRVGPDSSPGWGKGILATELDRNRTGQYDMDFEQFRSIVTDRLNAIVISLTESGAAISAISRVENIRINLAAKDVGPVYVYLRSKSNIEPSLFLKVLYVEELVSAILSVGRVGDRAVVENSLFEYLH